MKLLGTLIVSATRAVLQVLLSEVIPTTVRGSAIGICMAVYSFSQILPNFFLQLVSINREYFL